MDDFERWRGVVRVRADTKHMVLPTYGLHMVHVPATKVICHSLIFPIAKFVMLRRQFCPYPEIGDANFKCAL